MKLRSRKQLIFFISLISVALTIVFSFLIPVPMHPYCVKIHEVKDPFIPNPNIVYHDFDHDGNSELLTLKYQEDLKQSAAKIYSANGGLVDQWTFCEHWLDRSFAFGDYDDDGKDEAYIFTQKRDSIFLYAFKPDEKFFFIYRKFIAKITFRDPHGGWDARIMPGGFWDSDSDGFGDFIFGIVAGLSLQPRRYYIFSPHKQRIIYKSPINYAYVISPQIFDMDKDGEPEIFNKGGYATDNLKGEKGLTDDHHAYLLVFDQHLQFKFPPIPFGARGSQIQVMPAPRYMPGSLLILHNYQGALDFHSSLLLFDGNGETRLHRKLPAHRNWNLLKLDRPEGEKVFLFDHQGCFEELGAHLSTVKKTMIPQAVGDVQGAFDLDGDFRKEWIFRSKQNITILRADFTDALSFKLPHENARLLLSLKKQNDRKPLLSLQSGNKRFLIAYVRNPLFPMRFFIYFGLFSVFFALFYFLFKATNYFISYSDALNIMIRNPQRGILLLDEKGRIFEVNQTLIKQMYLNLSSLKKKTYREVFAHVPTIRDFISETIHSLKKQNKEFLISGDHFSFRGRLFIRPVNGLLNYPIGFYLETNDYALPVQNDRLKVWSKTVQKMAHDIKTPLSSISINLSMVKQKLIDHAPNALEYVGEDIEIMLGEMNRLREMTKNFLKFTNLEKPNLHSFSLRTLLQEVFENFKSYYTETVDLILDYNYDKDTICADRAQLKMAIHALLENAIDAVKGNGMVGISVNESQRIDQGFEDFIEIDIFDNGAGIPENILNKLFEPYFTTKPDGTGMGLAIAKKIIEDHNGSIEVVSTKKYSTVFRIMLPIGNICQ